MKTSFKKVMKCFLKSLPGISYLTHKGYLSGDFWNGGCPEGFCPGGLCPDTFPISYQLYRDELFQCRVFRQTDKLSGCLGTFRNFLIGGYVKNKIWNVPQPQQPITVQKLSATML